MQPTPQAIRATLREIAGHDGPRPTASADMVQFLEAYRAQQGVVPIHYFSVARDFTDCPGGRTRAEHSRAGYSGEELRALLVPLLRDCTPVEYGGPGCVALVVDLNGTMGYASSFLDEVFRKLISDEGFTLGGLQEYLILLDTNGTDPDGRGYRSEIEEMVEEAETYMSEPISVFHGYFDRNPTKLTYATFENRELGADAIAGRNLQDNITLVFSGSCREVLAWIRDNPLTLTTENNA